MMKSKYTRLLSLSIACAGLTLIGGSSMSAEAQTRDPFAKAPYSTPRTVSSGAPSTSSGRVKVDKPKPAGPPPISVVTAPPIESRIAYYKNLRESAASNGLEIPKVTSVLTLDEMAVIGIFRTPRGYAAMVEAKPIKLSYTIYPGEKFFDGQLVAIEENRLVFRKVSKLSNNKFTTVVENKTLRQYSVEQEVQGTAPVQTVEKKEEQANMVIVPKDSQVVVAPSVIISPVDEMNRQPKEEPAKAEKGKPAKNSKKTVKVAKNKKSETPE
jgi:hypothetical protein